MKDERPISNFVPTLVILCVTVLILVFFLGIVNVWIYTPSVRNILSPLAYVGIGLGMGLFILAFCLGVTEWIKLNNDIGHSLEPAQGDNENHSDVEYSVSSKSLFFRYLIFVLGVSIGFYVYNWYYENIALAVVLAALMIGSGASRRNFTCPLDTKYCASTFIFMIIGLLSTFLFGLTGGFLNWMHSGEAAWLHKLIEKEFWLRWEISAVILHIIIVCSFFYDFSQRPDAFWGRRDQPTETKDWLYVVVYPTILSGIILLISGGFFVGFIGSNSTIESFRLCTFGSMTTIEHADLSINYFLYAYFLTLSLTILIFADWAASYYTTDHSLEYSLRDMLLFGDIPLLLGTIGIFVSYVLSFSLTETSQYTRTAFFGGGIAFQLSLIHVLNVATKARELNGAYNMIRRSYFICNNSHCGAISCDHCSPSQCPIDAEHDRDLDRTIWVKESPTDNFLT